MIVAYWAKKSVFGNSGSERCAGFSSSNIHTLIANNEESYRKENFFAYGAIISRKYGTYTLSNVCHVYSTCQSQG